MPILKTKRLILREFAVNDAEFVLELLTQPSFLRFIGDKGVTNLEEAADYITTGPIASYKKHGIGLYLVKTRKDGRHSTTSISVSHSCLSSGDADTRSNRQAKFLITAITR